MGKQITLADIALMPAIVRMNDLNLDHMWDDRPNVARWFDAIQAHSAFRPTYYFGSLLTERFPHLQEIAKRKQAAQPA
jgi:glutathione S-transferase